MYLRVLCSISLLAFGTLLGSSAARAACPTTTGVPCPTNSTVPCGIPLVGNTGATADPIGVFTITVKDGNGAALANGSDVWLDFSACCNDIRISSTQLGAGLTVGPGKTVHATTVGGVATFRIMGAASGGTVPTTPSSGCASVWAQDVGAAVQLTDGVAHMLVQVSTYDLNGAVTGGAGVSAADLSTWAADFFNSPPYRARSDYDYPVLCVQNIGAADLSKWLNAFFAAGSTSNGPGYLVCP